ncbi:hypothetical protein [Streptomyces sp. NBC_01565]|uniref:hypothetical protein n=1 Tax=unclassified Streptomyces TaxID=2593676 RepID=UPI002256F893|nr:hypothetical protein [Streptomyces sp. NBC_01565]MCX4545580.1 hypothetical protein [Streptomyces sp. NBC_01565]
MTDPKSSDLSGLMRERLARLQRDYDEGQTQLHRLMRDEAATRDALLRVSGAMQVLAELLPDDGPPAGQAADGANGAAATAEANSHPGPRVVSVP